MASIIKVQDVQNSSGANIINESSNTITIGASGDTITIPSGATITNNGTASGFGGGKIGQVVQGSLSSLVTTSSSTFSDTGLTASITPSSTSSKILVFVNLNGAGKQNNNTRAEFKLLRGTTDITGINSIVGSTNDSSENYVGTVSTTFLDSPSSTSSTSYKIQIKSTNNVGIAVLNNYATSINSSVSYITLMEVLA